MLLSLQRLEDIRSHVMYDEVKYLNQSMVQISVGLEKEEEKEKEEKYEKVEKVEKVKKDGTNEVMNLNQSTVTIDL